MISARAGRLPGDQLPSGLILPGVVEGVDEGTNVEVVPPAQALSRVMPYPAVLGAETYCCQVPGMLGYLPVRRNFMNGLISEVDIESTIRLPGCIMHEDHDDQRLRCGKIAPLEL